MQDIFVPESRQMITRYDAAVVRDAATFAREFGNDNGFSRGRTMRHIGCIPLSEYQQLEMEAREAGEVLTSARIRQYLQDHPEYRTVRRLDSGWTGQVRSA